MVLLGVEGCAAGHARRKNFGAKAPLAGLFFLLRRPEGAKIRRGKNSRFAGAWQHASGLTPLIPLIKTENPPEKPGLFSGAHAPAHAAGARPGTSRRAEEDGFMNDDAKRDAEPSAPEKVEEEALRQRMLEEEEADRAKKKAAVSSVLWSALLTVIKLVAGLSTNSLGLLSEALHSTLDFVAAGITCLAVRISAQPADERHPYGHGKAESLAALAETALLVVTCAWIVMEAVERLFFDAGPVEPSWWAFGVVVISLAVDISRSAMLRRVAREHRSQALEADAMHFTTDIWSSAVVLVGLACVAAASWVQQDSFLYAALTRADAVAALGVAGIVLVVSWNMARNAVLTLMDGGMGEEARRVRAALASGAPAYAARSVRVRESGARHFVDLVVTAPSSFRVDTAHEVSTMLENIVRGVLPDAEITVHVEPEEENRRDFYATSYRLAAVHQLMIHNLRLVVQDDGMHVEVHIELPDDMPLAEAHEKVTAYESDLRKRVGASYVVSHMEPRGGRGKGSAPVSLEDVTRAVNEALAASPLHAAHHLHAHTGEDGTSVTFHCRSGAATVGEGHNLATRLEADIRARLPELGQIVIHVEPEAGK